MPSCTATASTLGIASASVERCASVKTLDESCRLILTYLIPLRLMRGVLPSALLLSAFHRLKVIYDPFLAAFRVGDVKKYDEALVWAEKRLLESGTYLAVESAREGCLKGLLRRVCVPAGPLDRRHRRLPQLQSHARILAHPHPRRHVPPRAARGRRHCRPGRGRVHPRQHDIQGEFSMANLLLAAHQTGQGHMKGYISHEKAMVVLSGKGALALQYYRIALMHARPQMPSQSCRRRFPHDALHFFCRVRCSPCVCSIVYWYIRLPCLALPLEMPATPTQVFPPDCWRVERRPGGP